MKGCRAVWGAMVVLVVAGGYIAGAAQEMRMPPRPQELVEIGIRTPLGTGAAIPIQVAVGSTFGITLPSNPTTGYSWRMAGQPAAAVTSAGSHYVAPNEGRVGQGGVETWEFRAAQRGKATVTLEYARPWEKGIPPVRRQAFAVVVY